MSALTFECPKCKQSLEGDDSMRGHVIECPCCNAPIPVPAHQKKHVIRARMGPTGTITAYTQQPSAKSSPFGIFVGLILGLVIGLVIGYVTGRNFQAVP